MTRSNKGAPRRKIFYKQVIQKARKEGLSFEIALEKIVAPPIVKALVSPDTFERRYPGRSNGMQWNCDACISGSNVDDGELFIDDEDVYDFKIDFTDTRDTPHHTDMTVSLLDIARPAKRKGVAKDFEILQKVPNVIALEDDLESLGFEWEEDGWEQIYDERHTKELRSYSSVLRDSET